MSAARHSHLTQFSHIPSVSNFSSVRPDPTHGHGVNYGLTWRWDIPPVFGLVLPVFFSVRPHNLSPLWYVNCHRRSQFLLSSQNFNQKRKIFSELNKLNKQTLLFFSFHDWMNRINKLTLKDDTISCCFTLFICGGPCHLSSSHLASNCVLGTLFSSENRLFIQRGKFSLYYYLIYIGVSKTT